MDINSLLSPAESPAEETPPPPAPPSNHSSPARRPTRPSVQQRKSSGLSQQYSPSPRSEHSLPSFAAHNAAYQNQQAVYGQAHTHNIHGRMPPPIASPSPLPTSDPRQAQVHPVMQRHGSTPQMDTLAGAHERVALKPAPLTAVTDLASMQHQPQSNPRPTPPSRDSQTPSSYSLHSLPRPPLSARSSNEIVMTDPATQQHRSYRAQALSQEECQALDELGNHLVTNPFDYPSHVRFITLLQQGLAQHKSHGADARTYELLQELREARKQMESVFPVGEQLWSSWLDDEMALAITVDDRLRIMDLFKVAVRDEKASVRLWRKFGDYAYYLWATAYGVYGSHPDQAWTAQDVQIGKEYFKWGPMLGVWEEGVAHTRYRLNDGHEVWDQYINVLIQDHEKWPDKQKLINIEHKFAERLLEAHATWDQTLQNFASFVSRHDTKNYEAIMEQVSNQRGAKTAWRIREKFENTIQQTAETGDETAEYGAYVEYLNWELQKKGVFSFRMINSLYERATVRFPSVQSLWIDYVDFLVKDRDAQDSTVEAVIESATKHCPWSGDLWAHRLLLLESQAKSFPEIDQVKHRATSTGLLDVGGMEELMKVYVAWCGGLRRRAFAPGAFEDDLDIAEVAISSALEHVRKIGFDKYGAKFTGDPHYRLERIYIKFLMQKGDVEAARNVWVDLKKVQGNYYDFWYRYYIWEMVIWAKFSMRATNEPETQLRCPDLATQLLKEALGNLDTLDWPEQLVPMYLNHCEHHESVSELRRAVITARDVNRQITRRREKEAAESSQAQAAQVRTETPAQSNQDGSTSRVVIQSGDSIQASETISNGKRKREDDSATDSSTKKSKSDEPEPKDQTSSATQQLKRDREHTTVIVDNLPLKASEAQIARFFQECGTVKSFKLVRNKENQSATIEFESEEEASYSLIKSGKMFQGNEISVRFGTGCTVYTTNYPPEADKQYLQNLFGVAGEIVDIRLPSLKANTHRRFAYIQFLHPDQAFKALELDGKLLDDKYKLVAKISDPKVAANREGAQAEGRECFVGNVYWFATEDDLRTLFESAGEVESVRIPRKMDGKSKGSAFVIFRTAEGAKKAVEKYNEFEFKQRKLHVEVAKAKASRTATTIHRDSTMSPAPSMPDTVTNGASEVDSVTGDHNAGNKDWKERTIALMNVPDTVNATRLEKLAADHGAIKKFTLRPDHAGAIIEYVEISSVGKAQMGLDGFELDDQKLRVGTVPELKQQHAQVKDKKYVPPKSKTQLKKQGLALGPPIARPPQASRGARGGRRGGLGFSKRAGPVKTEDDGQTGPKSNDYFRNLMVASAAKEADAPKTTESTIKKESAEVSVPEPTQMNGDGGDLLDDIMGDGEEEEDGEDLKGKETDPDDAVEATGGDDDDGLLDDLMEG